MTIEDREKDLNSKEYLTEDIHKKAEELSHLFAGYNLTETGSVDISIAKVKEKIDNVLQELEENQSGEFLNLIFLYILKNIGDYSVEYVQRVFRNAYNNLDSDEFPQIREGKDLDYDRLFPTKETQYSEALDLSGVPDFEKDWYYRDHKEKVFEYFKKHNL